jgi:hypothetical protein
MKRLAFLSIFLLLLLTNCTGFPQAGVGNPEAQEAQGIGQVIFPLIPGTKWTYEGTVRWTEGFELKEKAVTWKMEVVDAVNRGEVAGYHMKGHPRELVWYVDGQEPGEYAILQVGANKFYYASIDAYQRLFNEADDLAGLVSEEDLFLELPLKEGKRFCETEQILREDGMYCWVIGKGEPVQMKNVAGLTMPAPLLEYPVQRSTLPDYIQIGFTPGVGITKFNYVHHGTTAEVNLELVEFVAGTSK